MPFNIQYPQKEWMVGLGYVTLFCINCELNQLQPKFLKLKDWAEHIDAPLSL